MGRTLAEKVWAAHVVKNGENGAPPIIRAEHTPYNTPHGRGNAPKTDFHAEGIRRPPRAAKRA